MLFVGPRNFTFATAFAALRKLLDPWEGIVSTCCDQEPLPHFHDELMTCIRSSLSWYKKATAHVEDSDDKLKFELKDELGLYSCKTKLSGHKQIKKIRALSKLPEPGNHRWKNGYDPVGSLNDYQHDVIWFQCPWPRESYENLYTYICKFLSNAAKYTHNGELVCLGVSILHGDYWQNCTHDSKHFHFLGTDTELIADIFSFGYESAATKYDRANKPSPETLFPAYHLTLVFERTLNNDIL